MPFFIALSLTLSFIVQTSNPLQDQLTSSIIIYSGLGFATISIFGAMYKIKSEKIWYDVFASSMLLAWFAYWKSTFNDDSPIFFLYPLYFTFMTAFVSLFFISQRHRIDNETLRQMQILSDKSQFKPWIVMICVLVSLELQQHYLLYPITMTLLILRFALSSCLEADK